MATALGLALCVIVADVASAASRPPQDSPEGFGVGTTGGRGGQVVRVTTAEQLKHELCRSIGAGGVCSDNEPRIVEVAGTFDYTGSEATKSGLGCDVGKACVAPYKTESLVLLNGDDKHCDGLPTRQIVFDKAGNNPLLVGSNKSVIGVGANATIKGKGLALKSVRNVAVRNLTISDINNGIVFAGDAVTLNDADHVWIDHNRFHNIGRQMIVGGFKPTTHMTISWNDFDGHNVYSHYCNGTHYWNLLLAGSEQSITLSHNWFREFSGRAPKIDGQSAVIHLVNNYFQNGSRHALDAVEPVKVLVEGNYFDHVAVPITVNSHPGYVFGSQGEPDTAAGANCQTALRRNCAGNIAMPAPSVNGFALQGQVMNAFAAVPKSEIAVPDAPGGVPAAVRENAGPGHL
jgi:pectin lyase